MTSTEIHHQRIAIAIVGAGIAGLALAVALARKGCYPTVIEQREPDRLGSDGLFLSLAPNGMNALRAIGVIDEIIEAGVIMSGLTLFNENGKRLGVIDYSSNAEDFGAPSVTIRRGAVVAVLVNAAQKLGVDIHFGCKATRLLETEGGYAVNFRGEDEEFDAVIACDGVRSMVRQVVFPKAPAPSYTGLIGSGGFVAGKTVRPTQGQMNMVFGRNAFFGYIKDENGPAFWFDTFAGSDESGTKTWNSRKEAEQIRHMHRNDPLDIADIVAEIGEIDRNYPIYDMPELQRWSNRNVLLIGDAAHAVAPHSGQGASMALEDAVVLAECLEQMPVPDAFLRFEGLRRERTQQAIRLGRRSGSTKKAESWLSRRIRDLVLPLVLPMSGRMQASLFRHRVDLMPLAMPTA